jgi:Tol biopolymer transport system component
VKKSWMIGLAVIFAMMIMAGCSENKPAANKEKAAPKEAPNGILADVGSVDRILCAHNVMDSATKKKYWTMEELDFSGNVVRSYTTAEQNLQGAQTPTYNANGTYCVYSANLGQGWDLLVSRCEDGSKPNRMTDANNNIEPHFVPSGRSIVLLVIRSKTGRDGNIMNFVLERGAAETITSTNSDQNVVLSNDGKWVAFDRAERGGRQVYYLRVDGSRLIKLTSGSGDHIRPSISPDGNWVAYELRLGRNSTIHSVNVDRTDDKELGPGAAPTISPDGAWIAAAPVDVKNGSCVIYPVAGGNSRNLLTGEQNLVSQVCWSPAADKAAALDATGHVVIVDVANGSKLGTSRDGDYGDMVFSPATKGDIIMNCFGQKLIDKNKIATGQAVGEKAPEVNGGEAAG